MKVLALFLSILMVTTSVFAVDDKKAVYVGGTSAIPEKTESTLDLSGESGATFKWKKGSWELPYAQVKTIEYGQHAGRRVGATVALGITTLGIGALPVLFSKKRRHYLTISYTDADGKEQAAIFELGKDAIRTSLKILEVRTGKTIDYEDEEARKSGNK